MDRLPTDVTSALEMMRFGCPLDKPLGDPDVAYFERRMLKAADILEGAVCQSLSQEAVREITHVICFDGEGAETLLCRGWKDCRAQFFSGIFGPDLKDWDQEAIPMWDADFADDDNWTFNEDRERHCFHSDVGEISRVSIYIVRSLAVALKREPNAALANDWARPTTAKIEASSAGPFPIYRVEDEVRASCHDPQACKLANRCLNEPPCYRFEAMTAPAAPDVVCCCAAHHPNHGRCLQCPIHGTLPPGASDD